jgi:hypothetical protein
MDEGSGIKQPSLERAHAMRPGKVMQSPRPVYIADAGNAASAAKAPR